MRILYIGDYQGPDLVAKRNIGANRHTGGTAKISRIAKALASQSHEVQVVSSGFPGNRSGKRFGAFDSVVDGTTIPVWYAPAIDIPRIGSRVFAFYLNQWLRSHGEWDAVIIYNFDFAQITIANYLAKAFSVPIIVEYEDSALISGQGRSWYAYRRGLRKIKSLRRSIRGAIVVCEELAQQLATDNVLVLPGMLDGARPTPKRDSVTANRPLLLYSGGLNSLKGPDLLMDALEFVRTPCNVAILGTGPLLGALRSRALKLKRHSCTVYGEVGTEEYRQILAGSDICVNPHRMELGHRGAVFPFKVIEYVGAGKPVVTSPISALHAELEGALVRYASDSSTELATAIDSAILDLRRLTPLAEAAALRAFECYSIPAVAAQLTGLLERATRKSCAA